ncbi:hypothetical protein BJ912DRAFT_353283 [Pholiota molesta]|nr:hypothetical protein BJ912DRAFT_353283 [Pholiota molesta]
MTGHNFLCPILAKGQTCTPCEELAAIDQEIATPNAKRTVIYGRMNRAHDPLTSKLPAEIVAKIFTNFLPIDVDAAYGVSVKRPGHHSITNPLSLGAVCSAWRAIAWSTPQLWTSISLCLNYINRARCDILCDWLGRSGELPLYIKIYEAAFMNLKDSELLWEVMNLFTLQSHKWFYFEYNMMPKYVHYLNSTFARAHTLNTLKIGFGGTSKINLGMIPNLRNLYMARPSMHYLSGVNWQKLTNLEAIFSSITMCSWVFSNAPYLKHCTFSILNPVIFYGDTSTAGIQKTIHQHDHLLFLHIKKWNTETDTSLHLLQFPALQHLTVDSDREPVDVVTIADFLQCSNCSLKFLDVNIEHCTPEDNLQLFSPLADIPSLENLELRCSSKLSKDYPIPTCYSIDDLRATRKRLRQTI